MRLITFELDGVTKPGAIVGEYVVDLSPIAPDTISLLQAGDFALSEAAAVINASSVDIQRFPLAEVRVLAPILRPGKIIAVGLNYRDHALETGMEIPTTPVIFAKFSTSIAGHGQPVYVPADDLQVDYEAELAVIIGKTAKSVRASEAFDFVAGYMPLNDVSARKWQFADKQWVRGKSLDTFCPTGPCLTLKDEVPDPHRLRITARVNGRVVQDSNTSNLIFGIPELIEFISEAITLEPGDIIATGTPAGVGVFRNPPSFLQHQDVVEVEIEKLGLLRNRVLYLARS